MPLLDLEFKTIVKTYPVIEIFESLQGEGIYVGEKHLFLRFDKCNIDCVYCDELHKPSRNRSVEDISQELESFIFQKDPPRQLSFTGGEPLLYPEAIQKIIPRFQGRIRFYLETNGNLPRQLRKVVSEVDVIAMDIKLKSISRTENTFFQNKEFLEIAWASKKEIFVKVVVGTRMNFPEFQEAVTIIHAVNPAIPLILMPLTSPDEPSQGQVLTRAFREASEKLEDVRIIPRLHEILKIR